MKELILVTQDTNVSLCGGNLIVESRDFSLPDKPKKSRIVHIFDLTRIVCVGRPNITYPTIEKMTRLGIPIIMLSRAGKFIGEITSPYFVGNAARRIRQYRLSCDNDFNMKVAQKLIVAKIKNSRSVLMRLDAHRKKHSAEVNELKLFADEVLRANDISGIRGIEGIAQAIYYRAIARYIPEKYQFFGRNRRPPKDKVNACLSLAYSLLASEISVVARKYGLDTGIGVMHCLRVNRPALALDLMEPFRAPFCDLMVLNLVTHNILDEDDFISCDCGGISLSDKGRKVFFEYYDCSLLHNFMPYGAKEHTTWHGAFCTDVERFIGMMHNNYKDDFFRFKE